MPTEAQLNFALAQALLRDDQSFAAWFLALTRFKELAARCVDVRADNPWSRVAITLPVDEDGVAKQLVRDAETDVLAIYQTSDGRRIALHIENKLERSAFTPFQPESYQARLDQWRNRERLGKYIEATSVLLAPRTFLSRNPEGSSLFETQVAHEDVAPFLPTFSPSSAA